jgi:hypothetical protein
MSVSASAAALQPATPTDCRHSRQAFDALFAVIGERRDLSPGAKLLYGKHVTMHRLGESWTQQQIADSLGTCRQNVWRWQCELVAADLLIVVRLGQGRPNQYTLLGVPQEDLDGKAPRFKRPGSGHQDGRRPDADRHDSYRKKENRERTGVHTPPNCSTCGAARSGPHLQPECYRMPT